MEGVVQPAGLALQQTLNNIDGRLNNIEATQVVHTATLAGHTATLAGHTARLTNIEATQVAHTARLTNIEATVGAHTATLAGMAASLANIEALLVHLDVPHIAATTTRICQEIATAKFANHHDRRDIAYVIVPCSNGALPVHWPAGFDRNAHFRGPIAVIDALLADYGTPVVGAAAGTPDVRRDLLAICIGTMRT